MKICNINYWREIQNNLNNGENSTKLAKIHGEWFDEMQWVYNSIQLFIIKNVIQWLKRYWTFRYWKKTVNFIHVYSNKWNLMQNKIIILLSNIEKIPLTSHFCLPISSNTEVSTVYIYILL